MLKHKVVSLFAQLGVSLGMPSDQTELLGLIRRLHPVKGGHELIRLGSSGDGGYLIPDDLEGIMACFSPGVDDRASFESEIAARGIRCFLADASVDSAPRDNELFQFLPKFLGVVNDERTITLDRWVDENAPGDRDLLLQMDIEGAEWPVLLSVSEATLKRFRIIVLELHGLDRLLDREAFATIKATFERLLEHFVPVHNHPNNYGGQVRRGDLLIPRVHEMTLLRRDRVQDWSTAVTFPHSLDRDNATSLPSVVLPAMWHG